jgi:hypothetical protein
MVRKKEIVMNTKNLSKIFVAWLIVAAVLTTGCSESDKIETDLIRVDFNERIVGLYIDGVNNNESIVTNGEWSSAFLEKGAGDFVGGFHGDYELTSQTVESYNNKTVIKQSGYLTSWYTGDVICVYERIYEISSNNIRVIQEFTWAKEVKLQKTFFAMLPIKRENVSSYETRYPSGHYQDVSTVDFERVTTSDNQVVVEGSELMVSIEVVNSSSNQVNVFVSNAKPYNKVYFSYKKNEYKTTIGEKWSTEVLYSFDVL